MTPVFLLSDGYIANGAEPWMFPSAADLSPISIPKTIKTEHYMPYERDEKQVREWAIPGTPGLEHRLGGLEKEHITGNVSYDSDNHEYMVKVRAEKVEKIAHYVPIQQLDSGKNDATVLVVGWGSTYGAIKAAVKELLEDNYSVAHIHLRYINPSQLTSKHF